MSATLRLYPHGILVAIVEREKPPILEGAITILGIGTCRTFHSEDLRVRLQCMEQGDGEEQKEQVSGRCPYVLSESLGCRCSLRSGHEGNHHVELDASTHAPPVN